MDNKEMLVLPESVIDDTRKFRGEAEKFLDGQMEPAVFKHYNAVMGIYEHRTAGEYMVRIRIGGGIVVGYQLRKIGELCEKYANGVLHLTTRQDIQLHGVAVENLADVLEELLEVGLATRGGGGNTVRNVTACPRSGVCKKEKFDVAPYSIAVAEYLLRKAESFLLPRKYKISFSGCKKDCALASVSDLGFFAKIKDGKKGFAVYAAGGLGKKSRVAEEIEEFVEEGEIFEVAEAVRSLFGKYGNRENRFKARLRFVLEKFGKDKFVELYREERKKAGEQIAKDELPEIIKIKYPAGKKNGQKLGDSSNWQKDKQDGFATVRLSVADGDISAGDILKVAGIAEKYSKGYLRTTQLQDLLISSVSIEDVSKVEEDLGKLSIDVSGKRKNNIVTCTGAGTCKLGICLSKNLAAAISEKLNENDTPNTNEVIRISGCPNSCGQHSISKLGFQGKVKKVDGKLMPHYDVFFDGRVGDGVARLGERLGAVPAKLIPELVLRVLNTKKLKKDYLLATIDELNGLVAENVPEEFYCDFGCRDAFSLKNIGKS